MTTTTRRFITTLVASVVAVAAASVTPSAAQAREGDELLDVRVDFTGGIGLYLRDEPRHEAKVLAVPDGTLVSAECWAMGDDMTNIYGYTSPFWVRLPGGLYVAEAFADTGSYGPPPQLPSCALKDTRLRLGNPEPADLHDTFYDYVAWGDDVLVSRDRTREVAEALASAQSFDRMVSCVGIDLLPVPYMKLDKLGLGHQLQVELSKSMIVESFCSDLSDWATDGRFASNTSSRAERLRSIAEADECAIIRGPVDSETLNEAWVRNRIDSTSDDRLCGG